TSLYSWAPSSSRDVCYSRSRTPPSPVPIVSQEIPEWQGQVSRPYKTGFQKSPQRSSFPPMDFQRHRKPKHRRRSTPTFESLTKLTPRVPSTVRNLASFARTSFLDPTFMCQNQLELPCVHKAQIELHQESFKLAKGPPKSQCLAHAIVESLDTEQATRDLHMCLAKGLENGRSQPSVEYPVCLLCGRCAPYCPHPHPQHGPCLLVYPRLNVQDGEVYMNLGFLLKIKRHEASKWGLVQAKDASKLQHSKEHPSKQERGQSRSLSRSRRLWSPTSSPRENFGGPQRNATLKAPPKAINPSYTGTQGCAAHMACVTQGFTL
uniref:4Fe-4S ferredoxin-type domain-containing protein n=1 Tax=Pseudonaja textilis TaxID=8673 RepID=A0A670YXF2_PSETE